MRKPLRTGQRASDSITTTTCRENCIQAGAVRLHYLDWGGEGPPLVLIHGLADNPYIFCDLAPAFTDRFHVIAYARRGAGRSEAKGPFDTATLTEDLRALMDALRIDRANLAGWSLGGNEITAMAAKYPERVLRIVYLDGGYDWADPQFGVAFRALPSGVLSLPATASASREAYVNHKRLVEYTRVGNVHVVEPYLHECVVVQPDGTVTPRMKAEVMDAMISTLLTDTKNYLPVACPALAVYADCFLNPFTADTELRRKVRAWEKQYMVPFRTKSIDRVRRELRNVEVITVPGTHEDFFFTCRDRLIRSMRRFFTREITNHGQTVGA